MKNASQPAHANDAKRLYDEVDCGGCAPAVYASPRDAYMEAQSIAESQDRHSPWDELMADLGVLQAQFATFHDRVFNYHRMQQQRSEKGRRVVCTPAETAYLASFSPNPHPMMAEALREVDMKLHGPESRL